MGFISGFLNKKATQYNISTSTSTSTGQPLETLVLVKTIKVFFSPNNPRAYGLFTAGQIKLGEFVAISEKQVLTNQVLEIDSVKYRVLIANPLQLKTRTLVYVNHLERFKH